MSERVWIMVKNYGYEGRTAPLLAFRSMSDAVNGYNAVTLDPSACSYEVFELPFFPEIHADGYDIKPVYPVSP